MPNSIYNIHNPLGVKYLTRLRIGFSHLKKNEFKRDFRDSVDPMYSCCSCIKAMINFFFHCANFDTYREILFDKIAAIDANILTQKEESIVNTLLFAKQDSENSFNKAMLNKLIEFILSTERFDNTLF